MAAAAGQVKVVGSDKFNRQNHLTATYEAVTMVVVITNDVAATSLMWGRHGFDGGKDSWDACRAPSPRKSGGHNVTANTQLALAA